VPATAEQVAELRRRVAGLAGLGGLGGLGGQIRRPAPPPPAERRLPDGFEPVATPWGPAWRREEVLGPAPAPLPAGFAYLDTETTGLAGGTGTYAFAAAVARPRPVGVELVQLFLPEPGAEAAFLHQVQTELTSSIGLATYNGGRFDLPLLRTRWIMARMPGELGHPPHLDLLDLTRALLRQRLEGCTLRQVEERVLHFERDSDLPSAMVPDAYLRYLSRASSPWLEAALSHNRWDVLTLHHLHRRLLARLAGEDPDMEGSDWLALGRHLDRQGRRADGWRALRNAVEMPGEAAAGAGLAVARKLVRRGRARAAESILAEISVRLPDRLDLAVARARILEWRLRDLEAALAVVEAALLYGDRGPLEKDLGRRRDRLKRRLERSLVGDRHRQPRRPYGQMPLLDDISQGFDQARVERPAGFRGDRLDGHQRRHRLAIDAAGG
jgi:hypothetical protein